MSNIVTDKKLWLAAVAAVLSAAPAFAQSTDARASIAAERNVQFYRPDEFKLAPGATEHDIVLMQEHQPWYATAHAEMNASDNAFLAAPKHADVWAAASFDAGFQSTINEAFDLQVGGQVSSSRFHRLSELDTDMLAGIVSVSEAFSESLRVGVDFVPSVYLGRGFEDQSLLSYEFALFGQCTHPLDDTTMLVGYARLSRFQTYPNDYTKWRAAFTAACQHQCTPRLVTSAGVTLAYSVYDDYFQDFTGQRRKDFLVNPFVSAVYQLNTWSEVAITLSYGRNFSDIDSVDYEAANFTPYVEVNWRF